MKRGCEAAESDKPGPSKKPKRRQVSLSTFKKWQAQLEREHQTMTWLRCDTDKSNPTVIDTLWSHASRTNEAKIIGMKNYSNAWINGSTNHKTSCVVDHANNDQRRAAMNHTRKASGTPITEYSPIARGLLNMDKATQDRINKKFDICYVMGKECLAFAKYPTLHELELRHGVDLGQAYKTKDSAKVFSHYIAEGQRQEFLESLSTSSFYSFLMDGSTDRRNVEDELIVILCSTKDTVAEEISTCVRFFSLQEPKKADADGLIDCLGRVLSGYWESQISETKQVFLMEGRF